MKRTFTVAAIMFMTAMLAKAETTELTTEPVAEEPASDVTEVTYNLETDMGTLESKKPLLPSPAAPATDKDKDFNYWSQAVLSRVKVTAYAQGGYTATFNEDGPNSNTFDLKRIVLMVGADIAPHFYAFFMHEFKSGAVQEYYMEYRPCKALNFRLGQSKIELSMENPLSPTILESISCSSQSVTWLCGGDPLIANGSGRDLGLMMYGNLFNDKLRYVVELVNGGQINKVDGNNQKNVIAKLEYKVIPTLKLSVSGQKGYGCAVATSPYNPTIAVGETYRQNRYAAGFEWRSCAKPIDYWRNRSTTVRCEALGGEDGDVGSFGIYGAATIPVYKQLDVVAVADYFNRNTDMRLKQTNLTLGLQYWIHKKCRLQMQYAYSIKNESMKAFTGMGNYSQLLSQVQVAF